MGIPATTPSSVPEKHWFSTIFHVFKHIGVAVGDAFVGLFGRDAAHSFAVGAESLLRTDLGKLAMIAVEEANGLAAKSEKRAVAFAKIAAGAKAAGLDVKDSLINMLIELAVSRMKGLFGSTP